MIIKHNKRFWYQWIYNPRRSNFYKLVTIGYKNNLDYYNVLSLIFDLFLMESPLHYIVPFRLSWSYTCWLPKPLLEYLSHQTPPLAFCELRWPRQHCSGVLHINVARKVAVVHLMRWWHLFLRYFWVPLFFICSWCTSPSTEFLGKSPRLLEYISELYLSYPKSYSSSDQLLIRILLTKPWVWIIHYHLLPLGLLMLSA